MGHKFIIVVRDSAEVNVIREHFSCKIPKDIEIITREDAEERGLLKTAYHPMPPKDAIYALSKEFDLRLSDNIMKEEHENIAENKRDIRFKALTDNRFSKPRHQRMQNPKRNLRSKRM